MVDQFKTQIDDIKKRTSDIKKMFEKYDFNGDLFAKIFDRIPVFMFYKDCENRIIKVNRFFCDVLNVEKEDVEGKHMSEFTDDKIVVAKYAQNDIDIIESGQPKTGIIEPMYDMDRWFRTDKFPVFDKKGQVIGVLGMSVEVVK